MVSRRAAEQPLPTDVRAAILTQATRLFAAHGFQGASLSDIAQAVGVTKPSVLHYFPSKEALREGVLGQMLGHFSEALPRVLLAATASEGRFDAVLGELVSFFRADPDRARLLIREVLDRPAEIRELLREHVRSWLAAIAEYIRRGQARGTHYADADAESYVIHALMLVVTAIASAPTMTALYADGPARAAEQRYYHELVRITKASLFLPERGPSVPPPGPQVTEKKGKGKRGA